MMVRIPRCYSPSKEIIVSTQLHGFSDASEEAYAGVIYLRIEYSTKRVHTSLVISKTKVSPIKRLSIPRLELCGAQTLTRLLRRTIKILQIPVRSVFAWTDSTVVLDWLSGNPRRFKTFVGNRVSLIIDQLPPERWRHIPGPENPADCASRGLFPSQHELWWDGPPWLKSESSMWPDQLNLSSTTIPEEERNVCHLATATTAQPIIPFDRFSTFSILCMTLTVAVCSTSLSQPSVYSVSLSQSQYALHHSHCHQYALYHSHSRSMLCITLTVISMLCITPTVTVCSASLSLSSVCSVSLSQSQYALYHPHSRQCDSNSRHRDGI